MRRATFSRVVYVRDTIAAIATGAGPSGIAIVRVSGDAASGVGGAVFRGFPASGAETHVLYPGRILDRGGRLVDRGLAVIMRSPRSYTGEDVLELHCHGGPAIARAVLGATLAAGARMAERGEFSARAYWNGKIDLAQAEAIADLIGARTVEAARVAAAQLDGALSRTVAGLRGEVIEIAARLEAAIDFADEDETGLDRERFVTAATAVIARLESVAATYEGGRRLRDGAVVALAGPPNVGKSSLVNRLLGEDRIIVTPIPGTTRDTIEEGLDLEGIPVSLVDTAGLRTTDDPVERFGVERARRVIETADLVLRVVDASVPWGGADAAAQHGAMTRPVIVVVNKMDLPRALDVDLVRRAHPGCTVVQTSATEGTGIDELRRALVLTLGSPDEGTSAVLTRERHKVKVDEALGHLRAALELVQQGHPPEIVAVEIGAVLAALEELVGAVTPDDVLERIFREFCIGK